MLSHRPFNWTSKTLKLVLNLGKTQLTPGQLTEAISALLEEATPGPETLRPMRSVVQLSPAATQRTATKYPTSSTDCLVRGELSDW